MIRKLTTHETRLLRQVFSAVRAAERGDVRAADEIRRQRPPLPYWLRRIGHAEGEVISAHERRLAGHAPIGLRSMGIVGAIPVGNRGAGELAPAIRLLLLLGDWRGAGELADRLPSGIAGGACGVITHELYCALYDAVRAPAAAGWVEWDGGKCVPTKEAICPF